MLILILILLVNIETYKWLISYYANNNDINTIMMIIEHMMKNNISINEDIMKIMENVKRLDQVLEYIETFNQK